MHFVMVKTGGRKFRCIKCDDIDPMQVPTFKHGRTAKNCVNRRDIGLGWVGGLAAFIVLEACFPRGRLAGPQYAAGVVR